VYVLTDNRFRWLSRFVGASGPEGAAAAARALHLPCGILCGALAGLGVPAVVTAEPGAPPACAFLRTLRPLRTFVRFHDALAQSAQTRQPLRTLRTARALTRRCRCVL
jgi:hypothetical protein